MKKIIICFIIFSSVFTYLGNDCFAQSRLSKASGIDNTFAWHTQELPKDNSGTTTIIVVGAVVVAVAVAYLIISSSGDKKEEKADTTSFDTNHTNGLRSLTKIIESKKESDYSPISFYFSSQANFMNTGTKKYSFGVQYNF